MIVRVVLRGFGRLQRPMAWTALAYGLVTLVGTVLRLIAGRTFGEMETDRREGRPPTERAVL